MTLLWTVATATAQAPIPFDQFVVKDKYVRFDMSPDGKRGVVTDISDPDNGKIVMLNLENLDDVKILDIKGLNVWGAQFADNKRLLVTFAIKKDVKLPVGWRARVEGELMSVLPDRTYYRMAVYSPEDESVQLLFTGGTSRVKRNRDLSLVANILPADPDHILMHATDHTPSLYKVSLIDGEAERIEKGKDYTRSWRVNSDGIPVVRIDGVRSGRLNRIYVRAPDEKRWTKVAVVKEKDLKNIYPIAQADQPHIYYVSARPEGTDRAAVYRYDLKSKTYLEKVASDDSVDVHKIITDKNNEYVGAIYFDDKLKYDFVDASLNNHVKALGSFFNQEFNIYVQEVSQDGLTWILYVEGPRDPGSYYVYNRTRKSIDHIFSITDDLPETKLSKTQLVNYTARDGTALRGYLTTPAGKTAANSPLVVWVHGGPESRDYIEFSTDVQFLASRGYSVFQPQFRGSSGFGDRFAEAGYGEWGGLMQDDVTDGVNHLIAQNQATSGRICIGGASYGGYAALMGAAKTPGLYQCAISINGVTDLVEQAQFNLDKYSDDKDLVEYVHKSIGHPKKDAARLMQNSPTYLADNISVPLLIIHGETDNVVPVEQAKLMQKAMMKAGNRPEFHIVYSGHNLINRDEEKFEDRIAPYRVTMTHVEKFLAENLK